MVLDLQSINERLARMREELSVLKSLQSFSLDKFKADAGAQRIAERCMQIAIQCCLDIANHIIAAKDMGRPENNEAMFEILGEYSVLSEDLVPNLIQMARFRNLLVHVYLRLDSTKVYEILQSRVRDIELFAAQIVSYLEKSDEDQA